MAEKRMIASNIFEDEWFGMMDPLMQIIWIGLIATVADDQGRFLLNIPLIRSRLFPYQDRNVDQIESEIMGIGAAEKIKIYIVNDKYYCQIIHWWKYQQPSWAMPSKYPAPEGWVDRIRYHTTNRAIYEENWNTPGGFITLSLPSAVPSGLSSDVGRGIGGEKEELRVREGGESNARELSNFDDIRILIETKTGYPIPNTKNDIDAINEFIKWEIIEADLDDAVQFFKDNNKIARGPYSIRNSVQTAKAKRIQKNGKKPFKDTKVWSEEC